ncbi:DsbA family oxidoreductase [Spongisporangium articulatum]|uniref:DsbA family oxidoreductase n=1 Tax=Spongisporangium articulatum TaxID=3362603 RepID=A0ABW8AIM8_9ACTN
MRVEVWSDITCPWCYVGLARFSKAVEGFEHGSSVQVEHRSFELDASAPTEVSGSNLEMLARKYGGSREQILAMEQRVAAQAEAEGLEYVPERPIGNTFLAHRVLHLAAAKGLRDELRDAIWHEHFGLGRNVFDAASLLPLAVSVGLPTEAVENVLGSEEFAAEVRSDEARASAVGVNGVPFFVLGDLDGEAQVFGVSGAQPLEGFRQALGQAWAAQR